jgi:MFS family permease
MEADGTQLVSQLKVYAGGNVQRALLTVCLGVISLLTVVDQTVVSTAMPSMAAELHAVHLYSWVATAYLLCSTITLPLFGRLSDIHGRKSVLVGSLLLFILGSALCGLSGAFATSGLLGGGLMQLVASRAMQGVGAAGILTTTFVIVSDLYPIEQRGRIIGALSATLAAAVIAGPLVGGFLTDLPAVHIGHTRLSGWRSIFFINIPLLSVPLYVIVKKMPYLPPTRKIRADYVGAILCVTTFAPLLIGITLLGQPGAAVASVGRGCFAAGGISLILLIVAQRRATDPLLPGALFSNRVFAIPNAAAFLSNAGFIGIIMFVPLYLQAVKGISATVSGTALIPLLAAITISSSVPGSMVTRRWRYQRVLIVSAAASCAAALLLSLVNRETSLAGVAVRLMLFGLAVGPLRSVLTLVVQGAADAAEVGIATSMLQFCYQLGAVSGIGVFGVIFSHSLMAGIPQHSAVNSAQISPMRSAGPEQLLPEQLRRSIRDGMYEYYALIERAARGDAAARELLANDDKAMVFLDSIATVSDARETQALTQLKATIWRQADVLSISISNKVERALASAITRVFVCAALLYAVCLLVVALLPRMPLICGKS